MENKASYESPIVEATEPEVIDINVPVNDIEALLVAVDGGNRAATVDVCNQIREMAQDQAPGKFPSAKHPK